MCDMLRDEAEDEEFFETMHEEDVKSEAETLEDDDDDEEEHHESEKSSSNAFNVLTDDEEEDYWSEWDAEDDVDAVCDESEEDEDIDNDVKLEKKLVDNNKVDIEKKEMANVKSVSNDKQKDLSDNTIALKSDFKSLNDHMTNEHKEFRAKWCHVL